MTGLPEVEIQEALFKRAALDEILEARSVGVFDHVPETAFKPYVVVGEMFSISDNAHGTPGFVTIATFSIWSEQRGFREAHEIKDRLLELFDHQPLDVDGFHHVETRFEFSQTLRDPNPNIRRALLRLRIVTEQE